LFDADGTLFDYHAAEAIALQRAFETVRAPFDGEILAAYRRINQELWMALERREITPAALPVRRFELLGEALGLACSPNELSSAYLQHLARCADMIDGADEVLRTLHPKHRIAIVTNGLQAVQRGRLALSPIREFVSEMIISEEVGAAKPERAFFDAAFERLGHPPKREVLVIGDSLSADMQGAADYGLDTCWFNPGGLPRPEALAITYEIEDLRQVVRLAGGDGFT
jgi:YjjG family noncanonical pyrimidine nucleotidase